MYPTAARTAEPPHHQVLFISALVLAMWALGEHTLRFSVLVDLNVDGTLALMSEGRVWRVLGYLVLLATAVLSAQVPLSGGLQPHRARLAACMLFTLWWTALSVVWSPLPFRSLRAVAVALTLWGCCTAISRKLSLAEIRAAGIIYSSGVVLLGVCCELWLNTWHPMSPDYRFSGTLHPNGQGLNCALLITCLIAWTASPGIRRICRNIGLVAAIFLLLRTQSRAAIMACTACGLLIVCLKWKKRAILLSTAGILLLCGSVTGILLYDGGQSLYGLRAAVTLKRDTVAAEGFADTRVAIWRQCLMYLSSRPIQGYGLGAFWSEDRTRDITASVGFDVATAHSAYIDTALGTGVVGCAALLATLLMALASYLGDYRRDRDRESRYAAALIVLLLTNMLLESVTTTTCATYILTLCVVTRSAFFRVADDPVQARQIGSIKPGLTDRVTVA